MGKRLSKTELLREIEAERTILLELIETCKPRELTRKGVNSANWSAKDVLAHLIDWENRVNFWYSESKQGRVPCVPDPRYGWKDIRALNDAIFRRHQRRSLASILAEFHQVHRLTLELISDVKEADFNRLELFEWLGKSWTLSDYVRANTASHYRWGRNKIRKWIRKIRC